MCKNSCISVPLFRASVLLLLPWQASGALGDRFGLLSTAHIVRGISFVLGSRTPEGSQTRLACSGSALHA